MASATRSVAKWIGIVLVVIVGVLVLGLVLVPPATRWFTDPWGAFYNATGSSDFVDGHYSTRIVPELQNVKVGDRININDMVAYEVVRADRGQTFGGALFSRKTMLGIKRTAESLSR